MKRVPFCLLLLIGLLFTSCIPTKDLIYLQGETDPSAQAVNPVVSKPYRLQTNDILNMAAKRIRFAWKMRDKSIYGDSLLL